MSQDLLAALCLVMVIEGLFLLGGPSAWKRIAAQMLELPDVTLRRFGGGMVIAGLLLLQVVR